MECQFKYQINIFRAYNLYEFLRFYLHSLNSDWLHSTSLPHYILALVGQNKES
jgi:hypothetical protein